MTDFDYDLFVIGSGSGGVRAARMAAMRGARVAIAEEYRVGGTCVIRGCVPKKFLVYAAAYGKAIKEAAGYGWNVGDVSHDWSKLCANLHDEVDRLSGIYWKNLSNSGVEIFQDRAELEDRHTVRLVNAGKTITAKYILVAVGGSPASLDIEGAELAISSNEVFLLKSRPQKVVIAGGGYIACEFAQVFAGLGSDVCQIYRGDTVLRGFDDDIRAHIHGELKRSGVRVMTHANIVRIEEAPNDQRRVFTDTGEELEADVVIQAVGRDAYTKGLGLAKAGVETSGNGAIIVDRFSKTNVDNIYAVGDVTNRINLTPVAIREGAAFAATVFGDEPTAFDHADVASAVFTQPPVGVVGLTEHEARKAYGEVDIYKATFKPMKNALSGSESRILVKLVVKQDDQRVVGVHMAGDDSPEIIQAVGIAVKAGLTKAQFDATCAVHPTVAEELVTLKEKWTPPEIA
ncbi:glutathione-disulfide reductase [Hyphobacterium sp. CCMP332]|uniref:glutathione-disulfide reductase n=1 Tax=Hyphobacterium sp. CCMP332 TaxID=2749086 RepID=UPI001650D3AE|nr:glutathione-disulfide reductase [Hyphobacterium sp. CCMP332]QNL19103.1 glutathione-disulfide reductase [Hyphobacterium sp. CCMP332]